MSFDFIITYFLGPMITILLALSVFFMHKSQKKLKGEFGLVIKFAYLTIIFIFLWGISQSLMHFGFYNDAKRILFSFFFSFLTSISLFLFSWKFYHFTQKISF